MDQESFSASTDPLKSIRQTADWLFEEFGAFYRERSHAEFRLRSLLREWHRELIARGSALSVERLYTEVVLQWLLLERINGAEGRLYAEEAEGFLEELTAYSALSITNFTSDGFKSSYFGDLHEASQELHIYGGVLDVLIGDLGKRALKTAYEDCFSRGAYSSSSETFSAVTASHLEFKASVLSAQRSGELKFNSDALIIAAADAGALEDQLTYGGLRRSAHAKLQRIHTDTAGYRGRFFRLEADVGEKLMRATMRERDNYSSLEALARDPEVVTAAGGEGSCFLKFLHELIDLARTIAPVYPVLHKRILQLSIRIDFRRSDPPSSLLLYNRIEILLKRAIRLSSPFALYEEAVALLMDYSASLDPSSEIFDWVQESCRELETDLLFISLDR